MNNNNYIYTIVLMMLNIKNIFLTTSLSFLFGFYSICHLFIYIKRIEDIGTYNRRSFEELNNNIYENDFKYKKLQNDVIRLHFEVNKLKKIVKCMKTDVENSFVSPLSVSSLGTLDISIDENDNNVVCDELCDFNDELKEFHELRSKGSSFNTNLVDDSNIDFEYDNDNEYIDDENILFQDKQNNNTNLEQTTSSVDSINYLKSIFGYEMIEQKNDTTVFNNTNNNIINNNINVDINNNINVNKNKINYNDLEINHIIKDDSSSINSYNSISRKRSLSVSDVNWVGITKKFIFG
jgi:hypothetical protein